MISILASFYILGTAGTVAAGDALTVGDFPFAMSTDSGASTHFSVGFNYNDASGLLFKCCPNTTTTVRMLAHSGVQGNPIRNGGRFQMMGNYFEF